MVGCGLNQLLKKVTDQPLARASNPSQDSIKKQLSYSCAGGWASSRAEEVAQRPCVLCTCTVDKKLCWVSHDKAIHRISSGLGTNTTPADPEIHVFSLHSYIHSTGTHSASTLSQVPCGLWQVPLDRKSLPHAAFTLVGEVSSVGGCFNRLPFIHLELSPDAQVYTGTVFGLGALPKGSEWGGEHVGRPSSPSWFHHRSRQHLALSLSFRP